MLILAAILLNSCWKLCFFSCQSEMKLCPEILAPWWHRSEATSIIECSFHTKKSAYETNRKTAYTLKYSDLSNCAHACFRTPSYIPTNMEPSTQQTPLHDMPPIYYANRCKSVVQCVILLSARWDV